MSSGRAVGLGLGFLRGFSLGVDISACFPLDTGHWILCPGRYLFYNPHDTSNISIHCRLPSKSFKIHSESVIQF